MKDLGKVIVLLLAFGFASQIWKIVGKSTTDTFVEGKKEGELEAVLDNKINEINSKTPHMVDAGTRLDNAISINNTLRYNYTLIDIEASEISDQEFHSAMEEKLINFVCTSMRTLVSFGVTISYAYYGNKGKEITVIDISPSACNS